MKSKRHIALLVFCAFALFQPAKAMDPFDYLPTEVVLRVVAVAAPAARFALYDVSRRFRTLVQSYWENQHARENDNALTEIQKIENVEARLNMVVHGDGLYLLINRDQKTVLLLLDRAKAFSKRAAVTLGAFGSMPTLIGELLYAPVPGMAAILVFPLHLRQAIAMIPAGCWPTRPIVFGKHLYVLNIEGSTVTKIDLATHEAKNIEVGRRPIGCIILNSWFYILIDVSNAILAWDPSEEKPQVRIDLESSPSHMAYHRGRLYVGYYAGRAISVIDPTTNTLVANIQVGAQPGQVFGIGRKVIVLDWEPLEPLRSERLQYTVVDIETHEKKIIFSGDEHGRPISFGNYICFGRRSEGLLCTNQDVDLESARVLIPGYTREMWSRGSYLFVHHPSQFRVRIFDAGLSEVAALVFPAHLHGNVKTVILKGRHLFIRDHRNVLHIFAIEGIAPAAKPLTL